MAWSGAVRHGSLGAAWRGSGFGPRVCLRDLRARPLILTRQSRHGWARWGVVWFGSARCGSLGLARSGMAWQGMAWRGKVFNAWLGCERRKLPSRSGWADYFDMAVLARPGEAWRGWVGQGVAVKAGQGSARFRWARHGSLGAAWQGTARRGKAGWGQA
ncbi:hypothetical protein HMPREF9306_01240 [Propionimicrobium lymphophilum ACS-093-V-SCH5]|uniref:Uncharacterized protein n=1 Tax=Propionimicrobium lymphophilum ACS-093-V-SCH5 TaxID=883161 RepID=S2WJU1_9ACTN|nr:hypothetical protein HMPREF9306_01240 [Propionimicrobium lymphophilum ACS-093-V-SCH5]